MLNQLLLPVDVDAFGGQWQQTQASSWPTNMPYLSGYQQQPQPFQPAHHSEYSQG